MSCQLGNQVGIERVLICLVVILHCLREFNYKRIVGIQDNLITVILSFLFNARMQYIEDEMSKRKEETPEEILGQGIYESKVKALYQLPENLEVESKSKKTEEMLSNQMLSGIPEVDLGLE